MELRAVRPVGYEYLGLTTELLQRQRLADPFAGPWEAADLQWWFTRDPHPSDDNAVVWLDGDVPVVATIFTRWSAGRYGCDVLGDSSFAPAWEVVRQRCAELTDASVEMALAPDDAVASREAMRAGFTELSETYHVTWLDAADRAAPTPVPAGYALVARSEQVGPHPMINRNGTEVEARLQACSLYRPDLDLAIVASNGDVAGYAMFWADERTGVGLVEPMRVEDSHGGRGLAGALLRAGLDRLAARGCRRFKVSHDDNNKIAQRLYLGAGFTRRTQDSVYRRRSPRTAVQ